MNNIRWPGPKGLGCVLFEKMNKYKDLTVHIDGETGKKETYGELLLRAIRTAQEMLDRGITSLDIISICSPNNMDCYVPYLAAIFIGAKVAPLDPNLTLNECVHLIKLVEPKFIFSCIESMELMEASIKKSKIPVDLVVFGETHVHIPFSKFLRNTGTEKDFVPKAENDLYNTALILFTSGTTGLPKGICLTHFGLLYQALNFTYPVTTTTHTLQFTRLYMISSHLFFLSFILGGGCRILIKKFHLETVVKCVHDYQVQIIFLSQYLAYQFTASPEYNKYDLSCLKAVYVSGGPVTECQILKLRRILPHAVVSMAYGMTETTGSGTLFSAIVDRKLIELKPTSCGKGIKGVQYKVLDLETNEEVGPNQHGELCMKTPAMMKGYYKNPEETAKVFHPDGYYRTGDIFYYDEDGCYYFVERIKDLMKFRSLYINPGELEEVLLQHPDVKEAVVISLPSKMDGDLPLGIVILKDGSKCTEQILVQFVDGKVPDHKRLRGGVRIVQQIPLTATSKYKRRELRNMAIKNTL